MAVGDFRIALDGSFKYGPAGISAPTVSNNVDSVQFAGTAIEASALRRGKRWKMTKAIALDGTLSFKVWDIEGDALVAALETAFMSLGKIALWPTAANSGKGLDADYAITGFNRGEENEQGFVEISVTAKPNDEQRDPVYQAG